MPARHGTMPAMHHGDIVPIGEILADHGGADRVIGLEVLKRIVGQDHTPAESVIRAIPLEYGDVRVRLAQFHRDREIEPRRTAPKTCNLHAAPPSMM